jgi:hypothetical protein
LHISPSLSYFGNWRRNWCLIPWIRSPLWSFPFSYREGKPNVWM